jgi:FkbM family methyltransferase
VYHPGDYLSRRVFLYEDFERAELAFAVERAHCGGAILDVGANIGLYTAACARAAGRRGRVVALEPGPATFAKLTCTCTTLGLSNVTLLQKAAGRHNSAGVLVRPDGGRDVHQHLADSRPGDGGNEVPVQITRLDDVCAREPDAVALMKLDVEGHEVAALEGAEQILANGHACLIVECCQPHLAAAGTSREQLWALLTRTHTCVGVISPEGTALPPTQASVGDTGAFNTLWMPSRRPASGE